MAEDEVVNKPSQEEVRQKTMKLQMPFIANKGQTDEGVAYYANTFGGTVFVTKEGEIVYVLPMRDGSAPGYGNKGELVEEGAQEPTSDGQQEGESVIHEDTVNEQSGGVALKEVIVGGMAGKVKGVMRSRTRVSDFRGNDPSKWKKNLATYEIVNLGEVYPGIEVKLRAYGNNVEKLFYLSPGADPGVIRIKLHGAQSLRVDEEGRLEADTALGPVKFTRPVVYQLEDASSRPGKGNFSPFLSSREGDDMAKAIEGEYEVNGDEYSFRLGDYDRSKGLIIDPLLASTFLGGLPSDDIGKILAVDSGGNVYVSGETSSSNFPTTVGAYDTLYGYTDVFISRFSSGLTSLLASTYLGGSAADYGRSLAIDSGGNVYVTGYTYSSNFPTTAGAYDTSYNSNTDVFISRFNSSLTSLLASTYLGGSGYDYGNSLAIDSGGNVYVAGYTPYTTYSNFPTTVGAYDTLLSGPRDAFISRLNSGLTSLLASTYLGGTNSDYGNSLAIDSGGNVYVTGDTWSPDFPTTVGAYDTLLGGNRDVFVSRLNSGLTSLLASTYLGGTNYDYGNSLAIDSGGNVYVTGDTWSSNFPTTRGTFRGAVDVFISRLNSGLTSLLASTYLGGSGSDYGNSLAIDSGGNVYVTGYTRSSDFPTTVGAYDTLLGGGEDVFVSRFNSDFSLFLASTFIGGNSTDSGYSLAIDSGGNVYVTGDTTSSNFPTTGFAYDTSHNGGKDVFISRLNSGLTSLLASTYLGGSGSDYGNSLAIDSGGNVYVTGYTSSPGFPTTSGVYDRSYNSNTDIFVSRLNSGLTSLLASTYLGGSAADYGRSLAIDSSGNLYVTGDTNSSDFPIAGGIVYDTSHNGGRDVFISRLNSGLTSLLASSYLGGAGTEYGNSLAIDSGGNLYVTGDTTSSNFPTTGFAYDTSHNGGKDVFISRLNSGLTSLLASTYLGGSGTDSGNSLAIGSGGNVYVTGYTYSMNFPTTVGAYDTSYNSGKTDVFISRLNSGLTSLLASTFLGGSDIDYGRSLAIEPFSGDVYVTGYTYSTNFPTTVGAYDTSYNSNTDVFVSRLNSGLTSLLASTYLGGSGSDSGYSLAIDSSWVVYVTGYTSSTDFPTTSNAYDRFYNGKTDVFVSGLYGDLTSLIDSTYLGGSGDDRGSSLAIRSYGDVYVTGYTTSSNFPSTTGVYDTTYNGDSDVFVSRVIGSGF